MRDFHLPGRSAVLATQAMAATSHPLATLTAVDTLKAGGSAADAAIAAAMVLNVAEPQMCGLGGDCFVLVKPAGREEVEALNGSGRAPAALSAEALRARGLTKMPIHGIDAVTLPGAVDALLSLHARHGRLPLDRVLAPGIAAATEGVPVAPRVAFDWADDLAVLQGDARKFFSLDLAATACTWGTPVGGGYGGVELLEHPPNGQGATAILLLNILKQFDLASMNPLGADRAHLEAEATKLAYDARNRFIADPAPRLDHMLSPETAARLAALIRPDAVIPDPAPLTEAIHRDTVYLTVVDRDRQAVSLIYSIFWGFGSGLASQKFGINFQNRGAGFSLTPGHPNEAAGGKRPMHTIIPAMLRQGGRVTMPFGVMGGAYQPCGHARLVSNLVDFGMGLQEAIDAPRCFAGAEGFEVERGYAPGVRDRLAQMGHNLTVPATPLGGAQAIVIGEDGVLTGGSDPRKDGCALGY